MITILEPLFDIIITKDEKVMIIISSRPTPQRNPFLVFDGKKTMALFRDENEIIKLTEIPRKALKTLKKTKQVLITEMDEESQTTRQYQLDLILDSKLNSKLKKESKFLY